MFLNFIACKYTDFSRLTGKFALLFCISAQESDKNDIITKGFTAFISESFPILYILRTFSNQIRN